MQRFDSEQQESPPLHPGLEQKSCYLSLVSSSKFISLLPKVKPFVEDVAVVVVVEIVDIGVSVGSVVKSGAVGLKQQSSVVSKPGLLMSQLLAPQRRSPSQCKLESQSPSPSLQGEDTEQQESPPLQTTSPTHTIQITGKGRQRELFNWNSKTTEIVLNCAPKRVRYQMERKS